MTPFLKLVADDLYDKMEGNFQDTTIIFPNKRASLFLNTYLWEKIRQTAGDSDLTMWAPDYTTISELFTSLSEHTMGDTIALVLTLWNVYQAKMKPTKSLDQLYSLMETMLSDFQDIDNNMVEPAKLFLNIADWKDMTDFSFLDEEQRNAIEQFFGKFFNSQPSAINPQPSTLSLQLSTLKLHFKTLWNSLTEIYKAYRQALLTAEGGTMVYEGMLKRGVIEALTGKDEEMRRRVDRRLASKTYVMVGFNVLNKTELELFRYLKQNRDAKFYWDYDLAYMQSREGRAGYEAGQFIRENILLLGDEFRGKDLFRNMRKRKEITFIQSPTDNAQTRYVDEWKRTHLKEGEPLRESAVILCNENLLQPVLHSIGQVESVNVTMGYPLTNTPVFSLVQTLLELQVHGRTASGAWRYKQVAAVLKHAFIQKLGGSACEEKLRMLTKRNIVFPTTELLADNNTLKRIFTPVSGLGLTAYLADIISMVGHSYQEAFDEKDFTLQIYKESLFVAYTVVNRIHTLQEGQGSRATLAVSDETLARLIRQQMSQATIPFHGEPAVGLQVMGLLETRNLDFRNVIMLSVNEGQMPKSDKRSSLIPYTLRAAYGMTTIEREVSLYAYYYYRLLQRAEHITLLYNVSTENGNKGEMSRFMLQTLAEADDLFGKGQEISLRAFTAASETQAAEPYSVVKTADVMKLFQARFSGERMLSPSAINTYMQCPLKFYFSHVMGIRPDKEVTEDVDKSTFGTIFHESMQQLYEPHVGKPFRSADAWALASDESLIVQKLNNAFSAYYPLPLNGTQLINRHVIKQFIINQIKADARMADELEAQGGYWQIISQEQKYSIPLPPLTAQLSTVNYNFGGYIDRLDLLHTPAGDRIRIVDYKTSNKPQTAKTIEELFDTQKCTNNYHIMQTLCYCTILTNPHCQPQLAALNPQPSALSPQLVPALMYCAKEDEKNYSGIIQLAPAEGAKKETMEDFKTQYAEAFNTLLYEKIKEIFTSHDENPEHGTFAQCTDEQNCAHCDFLAFCRRHPQKRY